jgi:ketosteroid isomerase-like protein
MVELPPEMLAHLQAVTTDAEQLRRVWAENGVLEFPYALPDMTSRIEGIDSLVGFFDGPRRWGGWTFEPVRLIVDQSRLLYAAEIRGEATWLRSGEPYVLDYVIWMELDEERRIVHWREYWDKARV